MRARPCTFRHFYGLTQTNIQSNTRGYEMRYPGSYEFLKLRIGAAANAVRVGPAAAAMCCGCHAPAKPFLTPGARKVNSDMTTMQSMHW
jgi:hypothetical protein